MKNFDDEFVKHVVDLMQSIGPVRAKRMFGGHGIFLEGLMLGLIADSVLYLKVDNETQREFESFGLQPFIYNRKGKGIRMSYYQAPEEAMDDSDAMNRWANKAYEAAVRTASKKKKS